MPKDRSLAEIGAPGDVPSTYVPARNTVLLALALAWAETLGARDLFVGVNVLDASGYPDCRPEFIRAFEALAQVATRGGGFRVHAPLIELTKAEIIRARACGSASTTASRTPATTRSATRRCGRCDACALRKKGFAEAGVPDPDALRVSALGQDEARDAAPAERGDRARPARGRPPQPGPLRRPARHQPGRARLHRSRAAVVVPRRADRVPDGDADAARRRRSGAARAARLRRGAPPALDPARVPGRAPRTRSPSRWSIPPIAEALEAVGRRLGRGSRRTWSPSCARCTTWSGCSGRRAVRGSSARGARELTARAGAATIDGASSRPQGLVMPPSFTLEPRRRRASPAGQLRIGRSRSVVSYGAACERDRHRDPSRADRRDVRSTTPRAAVTRSSCS